MNRDLRLFFLLARFIATVLALPDLRDNSRDPISVFVGEEVLLPCTVKNLEDNSVIWKRVKFGRAEILTAGTVRVTSDSRVSVLHTEGGDEWVLSISAARALDTAQYVCEVNSSPSVRIFLHLQVVTPSPPPHAMPFSIGHNYTECCLQKSVPAKCLGYCSLSNIILGKTGVPALECQDHLSSVAFCMADGRNHVPCCIREDIPEACREVCHGEYTLQSASVFHHYTCSYYSQATLACIAQGIEILPGPPREVSVEPLSDSEVRVTWLPPRQNGDTITQYIVNVTELKAFDELEQVGDEEDLAELSTVEEEEYFPADGTMPPMEAKVERQGRQQSPADKFREHKVDSNVTTLTVDNLKPYSMYEVEVIALNIHGTSLPSYRVRTLTLIPTADEEKEKKENGNSTVLEIPDVRACCIREGLPMQSCLHRFCDPSRADGIGLTDLMICAPWVGITVPCLTQRKDLTPCCRQRGLPDLCVNLCHSNISRIDFQYFQCLPHMSVYANCLMESYGVLPSPPKTLVINNVNPTWVILHWQPPEKLADTVLAYDVHVRDSNSDYTIIMNNTKSPFLLDGLTPDTNYEAYVTAVNEHGSSAASGRLLFRTDPEESVADETDEEVDKTDEELDEDTTTHPLYNVSDCCSKAGVNSSCLAVCDYRTKMHQVQDVLPGCMADFHKILRCGVGGRNHVPCCRRRGVQRTCLDLCAGVMKQPTSVLGALCIVDLISIVECLEEGTRTLPGPPYSFHVVNLNTTSVFLQWMPPLDGEVVSYDITYAMDTEPDKGKPLKQFIKVTVNASDTSTIIDNLEPNQAYVFYVMAANEFGWSLPSSEARINMTSENEGDSTSGVPSGPIGLAVSSKNTTSIEVVWLPPEFSHPTEQLKYKFYYIEGNNTMPHTVTTATLGLRLVDLSPNTRYEMYVTALSGKEESRIQETLTAFTDPAYAAFVEAPHIHPSTQIMEGGNMTVLCVAMGSPVPTVSVFVNGKLYNQELKSHLVTNIVNVTRDMAVVACFADNGYGDGMQTTKRIQISFGPSIVVGEAAEIMAGETATVECFVQGYPEPKLEFWRDVDGSRQKVQGDRFRIRTMQNAPDKYSMQLIVMNTTVRDQGNYICSAVNPLGHVMQPVAIRVKLPPTSRENSVKDCCVSQHVAPECLDACTFDIDIDAISQRFQCIPEVHKLMLCASDGGDHRRCCQGWGVPRRCLGWCHGQTIRHGAMCVTGFGKQIISCFQEGKDLLPGPPQELSVVSINDHTLEISWDSPIKNPGMVEFYRVTWRKTGSGKSIKFHNDTRSQQMTISSLVPGESYEIGVKAINHHGSSAISEILQYANQDIAEKLEDEEGNKTGLITGLVILAVVIIVGIFLGVLYYRKQNNYRSSGGVSFENPSYMRDGTSDTIQIAHAQETNGGFHIDAHKGDTTDTPSVGGFYEELDANSSNNKPNNNKDVF